MDGEISLEAPMPAVPTASLSTVKPQKILLADDNEIILKVLQNILESENYFTLNAKNGMEALYSSDFGDMDGITPLFGSWENRNGTLVPTGRRENRLSYGDKNRVDYEMTVNTELVGGKGYGIYFQADGDRKISGYCFQYDPGYGKGALGVRKIVNCKGKRPLSRTWIPDGFSMYNQSHGTTIISIGDPHVIKVDGEEVFNFHDSTLFIRLGRPEELG